MTFAREVSGNERLYLAGAGLAPPFAVQIFVEGRGELSVERLSSAVAAASEACPGARLVLRGGQWIDSTVAPPVRIVAERLDGSHLEANASLVAPLDPVRGPTCEVQIFPGVRTERPPPVGHPGERTTLVFRAFHGVMDARGALHWVKDVFRALRGEVPEGALSTHTDASLLDVVGVGHRREAPKLACASPLGIHHPNPNEFFWRRRTMAGTHPALVAKIAATMAARGRSLRVMVPVDMRRHDATLRSTANLSLPIFLDVEGDAWQRVHERLLTALANREELAKDGNEGLWARMPSFGVAAIMRGVVSLEGLLGKHLLASAIVSHLGSVDSRELSADGFIAETAYSPPVHAPLAPVSITALEWDRHVELGVACARGPNAEARVESLLDAITARANRAYSWPGNRTEKAFPARETVVSRFRARVKQAPDAVALLCEGRSMSYRELDRRSDAVASHLANAGIGPGAIVGVVADRNEHALSALLGILKAGAAYLPVDPRYPDERIGFMLTDSGSAACVVDRRYEERVRGLVAPSGAADEPQRFGGSCPLEGTESHLLLIRSGDQTPVSSEARPPTGTADLAYVIYTSGSTGRPKGVEIQHCALFNYLTWAARSYSVGASTRFALFTSLAFDLSVTSMLLPLITGGSVALFPEELDHLTLRRILVESGVTALKLTPTHLELLATLDVQPKGLSVVVVGGEQLTSSTARRAQERFGSGCRIINEYGPTEATVGCITHVFDSTRDVDPVVPIGLPIDNMKVFVLDASGSSAAEGAAGELFLAGAGLARGYLGRRDLDRDKFVRLADGTRAYRTGDLGRIREDGELEFLGRIDEQVKIRGHRIEPGEIEAVLTEHPDVERAVVVARAEASGCAKALCAYVIAPRVTEDALRTYLASRLPPPLVPSFITLVDELPQTVNGKLDVSALRDPTLSGRAAGGQEGPRGAVEAAVVAIWARLLGVNGVGIGPDADFHRLGGDSLTMVMMLAEVAKLAPGPEGERRFMRHAATIIEAPTLRSVCRLVEGAE